MAHIEVQLVCARRVLGSTDQTRTPAVQIGFAGVDQLPITIGLLEQSHLNARGCHATRCVQNVRRNRRSFWCRHCTYFATIFTIKRALVEDKRMRSYIRIKRMICIQRAEAFDLREFSIAFVPPIDLVLYIFSCFDYVRGWKYALN